MEGAEPFDNIDGNDDELEQQVSLTNQGLFFSLLIINLHFYDDYKC